MVGAGFRRARRLSDRSLANFILAYFSRGQRLKTRPLFEITRPNCARGAGYKLPNCLRISIVMKCFQRVAEAITQFKGPYHEPNLSARGFDRLGIDCLRCIGR